MGDQGHIRLKEFISETYLKQLIYKSIEDQVLQVYREDHQRVAVKTRLLIKTIVQSVLHHSTISFREEDLINIGIKKQTVIVALRYLQDKGIVEYNKGFGYICKKAVNGFYSMPTNFKLDPNIRLLIDSCIDDFKDTDKSLLELPDKWF